MNGYNFFNKYEVLKVCVKNIWFYLHVCFSLITSVSIMRHIISKKKFSTFSKRTGLSKTLSTIAEVKKIINKGLIHSTPTASGVQTPSKL